MMKKYALGCDCPLEYKAGCGIEEGYAEGRKGEKGLFHCLFKGQEKSEKEELELNEEPCKD